MKFKISRPTFGKEYFLFLLPLYFVFHGFVENYVSVSVAEVSELLFKYLIASAVLSGVFFLVFRSWRKSALYVFCLMIFYFFFGVIHDTAKQLLPNSFLVKYTFILPFALIVFILFAIAIRRSKKKSDKLVKYLNVLLVVLLLIDIPALISSVSNNNKELALQKEFTRCDTCKKPDIYLIIADEYAGHQELQDIFRFDNSSFEQALEQRKFHVIKNSKSNYNYTLFSCASILRMDFLRNIKGIHSNRQDINACYNAANTSSLWNFLNANGYTLKNYSFFNINNIPSGIPQNFLLIGKSLITSQTLFSRIDRDIRFNLVTRFKIKPEIERMAYYTKKANEKIYNSLLSEARQSSEQPRFIYTHLMMPHYPYYYDSSGHAYPLEAVTEGNQTNKQHYIEYLQWCNQKFLAVIDAILKNSREEPVILFLGDHGWRHFTEPVDHKYYYMNLSSVYLPGQDYSAFYEGFSNVNLLRAVLNAQFNQGMNLLKDSTVFIKD
jgi:hypothetical protein